MITSIKKIVNCVAFGSLPIGALARVSTGVLETCTAVVARSVVASLHGVLAVEPMPAGGADTPVVLAVTSVTATIFARVDLLLAIRPGVTR